MKLFISFVTNSEKEHEQWAKDENDIYWNLVGFKLNEGGIGKASLRSWTSSHIIVAACVRHTDLTGEIELEGANVNGYINYGLGLV